MTIEDERESKWEIDSLAGRPDGPVKFIEALGMEVPTYVDPRKDMWKKGVHGVLMYHVPLRYRGPYRSMAPDTAGPHGERKNDANYCMCMGVGLEITGNGTQRPNGVRNPNAGKPCENKAINYSGYCGCHGGALHPLDKSDPKNIPRELMFKHGKLDMSELDDEELAKGQVRKADGTWSNLRMVPQELHQRMMDELFKRADTRLRENLVAAVDTMAEIAKGSAYEPADRIRAAQFIFERVRGKNPDIVVHTQDKPFEMIMEAVLTGGSRAQSRATRGLEDGNTIEAEVIEDEPDDVPGSDAGMAEDVADEVEDYHEEYIESHQRFNEQPVLLPDALGRPTSAPPIDPELRQIYEDAAAAEKQRVREERAAFKALMNETRSKRYASRARGMDHVESFPYAHVDREAWEQDPEDPEDEIMVGYQVRFTEPLVPKMPASAKAAETKRRNRDRFK